MSVRERIARFLLRDANLSALINASERGGISVGSVPVNQETALRVSAVWACLRLRANLESSLPIDIYRDVDGTPYKVPKPRLFVEPYPDILWSEFMYGTRYDLDRYGNTMGIIHQWDSFGLPSQIEPLPMGAISVQVRDRQITEVRCGGDIVPLKYLWHEKQYAPAGYPLGMNPTMHAAWSLGGYLSAQERAIQKFGKDGGNPRGTLKNTKKELKPAEAAETKARWRAAVRNGDIFVTGNDWEWTPGEVDTVSSTFLEGMEVSIRDIARFYDVPGDMIDAPVQGGAITYANINQRNVQLLITSTGPAIQRREARFSAKALPQPRYARLDRAALLAMDPETQARVLTMRVNGRILTPTEARESYDLPPFSDADYAEFERLGFVSRATAAGTSPQQPSTPPQQQNARWEIPA